MVLHPNAGAVLVVGLGCENNQPDVFREFLGEYDSDRVKFMVTQKVGDEYEVRMKLLRELYAKASKDERVDVPLSELRVGLKCGGSDGFSGITANPLLGMFSDFLIAQGGTSVLTEVPEMFGAETILMNRCRNKELFEETVKLINDFKVYFLSHGEPVGENPSPGNKAGGISTLEDKALGCTQKCGKSYVEGVLPYGERLKVKGLNLLSAPGNELVAATAQGRNCVYKGDRLFVAPGLRRRNMMDVWMKSKLIIKIVTFTNGISIQRQNLSGTTGKVNHSAVAQNQLTFFTVRYEVRLTKGRAGF